MDEYIKREELLRHYDEYYCKPCRKKGDDYHGVRCRACGTGDAIETAEDIPAADVVEVVTCNSCKHYDKSTHNCGLYGVKHWGGFFCGDAEEEDDNDAR